MRSATLLASAAIVIAPVLGQSASTLPTTANTPTSTATDVDSIVSQLPTCALQCLESAAKAINCVAADLPCLCSKASELPSNIAPCILLSGCSSADQSKLVSSAQQICANINSAQPSQIAAASSYVASAVASNAASTANGNLARRTDVPVAGMGVVGAAAALAILTL